MLLTLEKYFNFLDKLNAYFNRFCDWVFSTWINKKLSNTFIYPYICFIIKFFVLRILEILAFFDFIFFIFWFKIWCVEWIKLHHIEGWIHTRKMVTQNRFVQWIMTFTFILHFVWHLISFQAFVIWWIISFFLYVELYWCRYKYEPRWINFEKNKAEF